jgi:signal transduction histidine kinase/CheY-like chemotaxis protein/HPt (histidine-containing phosphotransfer) domain-containing protein
MKRILAWTLLALFVTAIPAVAADLVVSRAVLEDKTGTLTIADVAKREFTSIGPTLSKGFTDSVHWLRVQVKAPAKGDEVVLFIRESFLNDIRLYEADTGAPQGWKTRVTGSYHPFRERDRGRMSLGFLVHVTVPEATYYLRLKTSDQSRMSLLALEPVEAEHLDGQFDMMEVLFVTAMMFLLLWGIHSYFQDRQLIIVLFALHQALYTLFGVAITGYLAPYIPAGYPHLADLAIIIPYCGGTFAIILFCRELFKPYEPPPLLIRGLNLFLCLFPVQLAAVAFGHAFIADILNFLLVRIIWWYFVIMAFTLRRELTPSRRTLQVSFIMIALVFNLFWYAHFFVAAGDNNYLSGRMVLIVYGLIVGGVFAMILNARSRRLLLEARQSALELQAKSEFLSLVSHEIRTPLNALVGFSALARKTHDQAKLEQYLHILEQSSGSLMELVNDILDMSKIEAGQLTLSDEAFNLHRLLAVLAEQYRPLATEKKLTFDLEVAGNVPEWVSGDSIRLRQILTNLIGNAMKFTEHGAVTCAVTMVSQAVRFDLRDTGIGIPEEKLPQLFRAFHQLDPGTSRRFGGTGLGLVIVKNLAEMMNGSITVSSRQGEGSCFTLELPLPEVEAVIDDGAVTSQPAAGEFLVVEDNNYNRRLLEEILTSWGGSVTLAEDGQQALNLIEKRSFDLILLDLRMPGIDGFEVARRIRYREQEWNEHPVPIIAITAEADIATRETCLDSGINAVLAKPIIPARLASAIAEYCHPAASAKSGLLLHASVTREMGDNPERAKQYREMLFQDIADELKSLQLAFESGNCSDLGRSAHTLKGLCGCLASSEPLDLAKWLQDNAESANVEKIQEVVEQLAAIFACREGWEGNS